MANAKAQMCFAAWIILQNSYRSKPMYHEIIKCILEDQKKEISLEEIALQAKKLGFSIGQTMLINTVIEMTRMQPPDDLRKIDKNGNVLFLLTNKQLEIYRKKSAAKAKFKSKKNDVLKTIRQLNRFFA